MLGVAGDAKCDPVTGSRKIAPVRSSSAVVISSEDSQRRRIITQQATTAANGMSGQAFNTHFAHTVRKTETKSCDDCHVSNRDDNNAWMAQLLLLGTGFVNFIGHRAYVGVGDG